MSLTKDVEVEVHDVPKADKKVEKKVKQVKKTE